MFLDASHVGCHRIAGTMSVTRGLPTWLGTLQQCASLSVTLDINMPARCILPLTRQDGGLWMYGARRCTRSQFASIESCTMEEDSARQEMQRPEQGMRTSTRYEEQHMESLKLHR